MQEYPSDFWWLPPGVDQSTRWVGVGHHEPHTDDDQPCLETWAKSLDEAGAVRPTSTPYPLRFLKAWYQRWDGCNVYRTLKLFNEQGQPCLLGPFLLDIDNEHDDGLRQAWEVTRIAVGLLLRPPHTVRMEDVRIFFSGRKGFHVEVRPGSLGIAPTLPIDDQIASADQKTREIISRLRCVNQVQSLYGNQVDHQRTLIDHIFKLWNSEIRHPYIRLHNSLNVWVDNSGARTARRRIEVRLDDLGSRAIETIVAEAEVG